MLSNFDPEGPSLSDKFGLYNLQAYDGEQQFIPSDETLVFGFKFDTERINHFLNMKLTKFEMIDNMYQAEYQNYWESISEQTHEHWNKMAEIDALVEEQADSTIRDIQGYLEENFTVSGEAMQ